MPTIGEIGSELAEVPVGDLLRSVAQGIADGQTALDVAAVKTLISAMSLGSCGRSTG